MLAALGKHVLLGWPKHRHDVWVRSTRCPGGTTLNKRERVKGVANCFALIKRTREHFPSLTRRATEFRVAQTSARCLGAKHKIHRFDRG